MDLVAHLDAACPPASLFAWIDDLSRYPHWLDIVAQARASGPETREEAVWDVDLRGRLGPLARVKRLRMVRTALVVPDRVRFERRELDGRHHACWVLTAEVAATGTGSELTMHLHYGGSLWGPLLEHLLSDAIERARPRLAALAEGTEPRTR